MKKNMLFLLIIMNIFLLVLPSYAANIEDDFNVYAKSELTIEDVVVGEKNVETGELVAKLPDGVIVKAKPMDGLAETIQLMVKPIQKSIHKEWDWLQSITASLGVNKSAYDIFFVNSKGKRVEVGGGCEISVISNQKEQNVYVYYVDDDGVRKALKSRIEDYVVKFNMVKNGFYTLLVKDNNKDTEHDFLKDEEGVSNKNKDKNDEDDDSENKKEEKQDDVKDEEDSDVDEKEEDGEMPDGYASEVDDIENEDNQINWVIIAIICIVLIIILIIFLHKRKKDKKGN